MCIGGGVRLRSPAGTRGMHIHVSEKHLPKGVAEFEYRWNMRAVPHLMLDRLMYSFVHWAKNVSSTYQT